MTLTGFTSRQGDISCHRLPVLLLMYIVTAVCNADPIRTEPVPADTAAPGISSERQLLDVGVGIFNPGVDNSDTAVGHVFPDIRRAEARYLPYRLMETLQASAHWGSVRMVPEDYDEMDVRVDGEILHSDGNTLRLQISVTDSSGELWYRKSYAEDYHYNPDARPYRKLYEQISADLSAYGRRLSAEQRTNLINITTLRFAQGMAPGIFAGYLTSDSHGRHQINRLPAKNSPDLQRISKIRSRYDMFLDTLQLHYSSFVARMKAPYLAWLAQSVREQANLRQLHQQSRHNIIHGVVTVFASLNPFSRFRRNRDRYGPVGITKGKDEIVSGFDAHQEAKIHALALQELGETFNAHIQPQVMQVDERTVILSGTVNEQLEQWQGILSEAYLNETSQSAPEQDGRQQTD